MEKQSKHGLSQIIISILLVLTIICVYVVGSNLGPMAAEKQIESVKNISAQPLSNLKDAEDIQTAENTTEFGKISEELQRAYSELPETVASDKELNKAVSEFDKTISNLENEAVKELNENECDTDYSDAVTENFTKIDECINNITRDNYEESIAEISAIIKPEKPYPVLADQLPFGNISLDSVKYAAYRDDDTTSALPDGPTTDEDLTQTNDTAINDEIRNAFADQKSVLDLYQYIQNNYKPEFYYGSRKGATGTFCETAGNDYDIASLLIGVLRDRNIPARYVKGEIKLTAQQAMEWTATDDINTAMRIISSLGIPVTGLVSNGETVAVSMEHIWVQAYVPYTDYRGTGNMTGKKLWIPLDASFKKMLHEGGVSITDIEDYVKDPANKITDSTEVFGVNIGELTDVTNDDNSALVKYMLENGYGESTLEQAFGGKSIITSDLGYLPMTLPYSVVNAEEPFDDIPDSLTDSVRVRLCGNSAMGTSLTGDDSIDYTYYAPDVYGKRIVLSYVPASENDVKVLEEYGNIFSAPAYLLKLKPQLIIDGKVVAEGSVCNAGYTQKYTLTVHNGSPRNNDSDITNNIEAGGMYCIAMDYGNISGNELQKSAQYLDSKKESTTVDNIYTEEIMGEILNSTSKLYFAQLDLYNRIIAGQRNVTASRALSIGIVGFKVNVAYTFDRPSELNEGGIFLDIGHDVHSAVSNTNNNKDEKAFMLQAGVYASAMEHGVLEQVTGIESVSTIKTFQYAQENNIPMHIIAKENLDEELAAISVSAQTVNAIRSAVNEGKVIVIPEKTITINQWSGEGYMVLDPDTCACGYMISGGTAGGAMTAGQVIEKYITYVCEGLITIILYELAKAAIMAALPFGWIGTAFTIVEIGMLLKYIYGIVDLFVQFHNTGKVEYLQEALIQIAAGLTIAAIMPAIKSDLEQMKADVTDLVNSLKAKPEYPTTPGGGCFIAGTLISTPNGLVPIENIKSGDIVWSFDPDTLTVSEKKVEQTFVRRNADIVRVTVVNDVITATSNHPFYVAKKGFTNAVDLRAGDILIDLNGNNVVVEKTQHEILESPVNVYNFRVAENHTYFVGTGSVGVHNAIGSCAADTPPEKPEVNPGEDVKPSPERTPELYDADGNYTGGRTPEELDNLAKDPAHNGSTSSHDAPHGEIERTAGLAAEESGQIKGPIVRDPSGKAEFLDANNTPWDVKSYNSYQRPRSGGYTFEKTMESINGELNSGENVIVDTTNMKPEHVNEIMTEINRLGLGDKVIFYIP